MRMVDGGGSGSSSSNRSNSKSSGGSQNNRNSSSHTHDHDMMAGPSKERRFEDIDSDDDNDDEMPAFLRPEGIQQSTVIDTTTRANKRSDISPPRKPRATLYEEEGEDNFIFSVDDKPVTRSRQTKAQVPGAKGLPPRSSSAADPTTIGAEREKMSKITDPRIDQSVRPREPNTAVDSVATSSVTKPLRRVSTLRDGTPAYPHPQISDGDLYRHCSGELVPQERMKHLVGWTLERSRSEMKRNGVPDLPTKYRSALLAALKSTLRDLSQGYLQLDWQKRDKGKGKDASSSSSSSGGGGGVSSSDASKTGRRPNGKHSGRTNLPPHPRNEANAQAEEQLQKTVEDMQRESIAWAEVEAELKAFEQETGRLERQPGNGHGEDDDDEGNLASLFLSTAQTWEDNGWSEKDRIVLQRAKEALATEALSTDVRPSTDQDGGFLLQKVGEASRLDGLWPNTALGTRSDPRWKDVEFKADLLRQRTHTPSQLSVQVQRYLDAVSARGAKALQELTQGQSPVGRISSETPSGYALSTEDDLGRVLSSIRTVEHISSDDADRRVIPGDTSEGDILRAFAQTK